MLSSDPDAVALNSYLRNFKKDLKQAYLDAKLNGIEPSLDYLKSEVFKKEEKELTFWGVWGVFLESKKINAQPEN